MHIDELCRLVGYTRRTVHDLVHRKLIPPPRGKTRSATYGAEHIEAIRAYQALRHLNTSMVEVADLCANDGITIIEYKQRREDAIRYHGLTGVA